MLIKVFLCYVFLLRFFFFTLQIRNFPSMLWGAVIGDLTNTDAEMDKNWITVYTRSLDE